MDKKYKEIQSYKDNEFKLQLEVKRLESKVKDLEIIKEKYNELLTKDERGYNEIEYPSNNLSNLEKSLKLSDTYTIKTLRNYLVLDSYELVKNMAKVVNSGNASEILAYRDGSLQRNESLIKMFDKIIKESEKIVHNKIKGEQL